MSSMLQKWFDESGFRLPTMPIRVVGIDLGTTNSTTSEIVFDPGQPDEILVRTLNLDQETRQGTYTHMLVPSVVANVVVDSKTRGEQFPPDRVVIMSYNFASARHTELRTVPFDMVVIDEAHKLRNVYKPNKKTAMNIRTALAGHRKVLLTATPLQNSLMELFGLSTILSAEIFGDADTFRMRFTQKNADLEALQSRLQTFCQRTLRRDVLEYIQYTERL